MSLVHAFGGKNLNDFTNYLMAHSDEISKSIDDMAKVILMATNGLVEICKELNTAVEKTVGWKVAFEGLLGLFALSKLIKPSGPASKIKADKKFGLPKVEMLLLPNSLLISKGHKKSKPKF